MSKVTRLVVLVVGLMSVFAAAAGAASATSWSASGDTTFTATTGPRTLTANGVSLTCTSATMTGATTGASNPGPIWTNFATGGITYNGCTWGGGFPIVVVCSYSLTAQAYNATTGVTTSSIRMNCTQTGGCTIAGTINGVTYRNPPAAGKLTFPASNTLVVGGAGCLLGTGPASMTAQTFDVISGTGGPIISQP